MICEYAQLPCRILLSHRKVHSNQWRNWKLEDASEGSPKSNIGVWIKKTKAVFASSRNIWKKQTDLSTQKNFNSNEKPMKQTHQRKIPNYYNRCLSTDACGHNSSQASQVTIQATGLWTLAMDSKVRLHYSSIQSNGRGSAESHQAPTNPFFINDHNPQPHPSTS